MKSTAVAPANIAFIKYWGLKDPHAVIPFNPSISMTLSGCLTTTTVEFRDDLLEDDIALQFSGSEYQPIQRTDGDKNALIFAHVERIRERAGIRQRVKIRSSNGFPSDAGIAASASGFAALTMALADAAGLSVVQDKKELSKLTRLGGSVSAMRSLYGGFVEAHTGTPDESFAEQIAPEDHWELCDVVAIVDTSAKQVSSSAGHARVTTSPHFQKRLEELPARLDACREAILTRDFTTLGECAEADTISMHQVVETSTPAMQYWNDDTRTVIAAVQKWRSGGLEAYFSIDAGANVHILCEAKTLARLQQQLADTPCVQSTILNRPAPGVHVIAEHLF